MEPEVWENAGRETQFIIENSSKKKASAKSFALYNVYGPYLERKGLWKEIFISTLIEARNMILGGDLNLTLSEKEN